MLWSLIIMLLIPFGRIYALGPSEEKVIQLQEKITMAENLPMGLLQDFNTHFADASSVSTQLHLDLHRIVRQFSIAISGFIDPNPEAATPAGLVDAWKIKLAQNIRAISPEMPDEETEKLALLILYSRVQTFESVISRKLYHEFREIFGDDASQFYFRLVTFEHEFRFTDAAVEVETRSKYEFTEASNSQIYFRVHAKRTLVIVPPKSWDDAFTEHLENLTEHVQIDLLEGNRS